MKKETIGLVIEDEALMPFYATEFSAGVDLRAHIKEPITLLPGKRALVPTGIKLALPEGVEGQVRSRSGLSWKNGVIVLNSPGTIDADFRGEISIVLANFGEEPFVIEPKMRIAQLVFASVVMADFAVMQELSQTVRGTGGFGSSGVL